MSLSDDWFKRWRVTPPFVGDGGEQIMQIENDWQMIAEVYDANNRLQQHAAVLMMAAPRLAELLRALHDLQNGPPLIKYSKEWRQVMHDAIEVLKVVESD